MKSAKKSFLTLFLFLFACSESNLITLKPSSNPQPTLKPIINNSPQPTAIPIPTVIPTSTSTPASGNSNIDKLYEEFKEKNEKELQDKIKNKPIETYDLKIYLNNQLKDNKDNKILVDISKSTDSLGINSDEGDIKDTSSSLVESIIIINNKPSSTLKIIPYTLIAELTSPDKLDDLKKLYGIKVMDQYNGSYLLMIDISKVDISKLDSLIMEYNKIIPENIKEIQFSSITGLKTFTAVLDILANHKDICKKVSFNTIMHPI